MSYSHDDPELDALWDALEAGVAAAPHPFHTAALATVGTHAGASVAAEVRTVVLRYVDRERWRVDLHTDLRSPKVAEIRANPAVSLLCYDAPGKRQLRLKGRATIHNRDELTAERWETVRSQSRLCYRTSAAPSSPVPGVSDGAGGQTDSLLTEGAGYENFCVVAVELTELEVLDLNHLGHSRHRWTRSDGGHERWEVAP